LENATLSVISANHPPLVPHMALLPANFAPSMAMLTAISSSHWKKVTFLSLMTTSMIELAGVIGYAAYKSMPLAIAQVPTSSFPNKKSLAGQIAADRSYLAVLKYSYHLARHSIFAANISPANHVANNFSHSSRAMPRSFMAAQKKKTFLYLMLGSLSGCIFLRL
jgi:hypothetical protein